MRFDRTISWFAGAALAAGVAFGALMAELLVTTAVVMAVYP